MAERSATVELTRLTKFYGSARGIEDVSFAVEEGEIFGLIGPNGAGKSTTIRTLLSLLRPTAGSARIFGRDVTRHGPEVRREIGYLPSEVFYYQGMRARDLLAYSASFYSKDCSRRIAELADLLDLDLSRKIDDLSYGNRKKVGIVQGLLHRPRLIILDEPTGGLDPLMQQHFFELLREENARGATVLFSSHILGEVQRLCDRVAIFKEGRLAKIETMRELTAATFKKVRVETEGPARKSHFRLAGVKNLEVDGTSASFVFKGNVRALAKALAALDLVNLSVTEPDLEEIFMHYYE